MPRPRLVRHLHHFRPPRRNALPEDAAFTLTEFANKGEAATTVSKEPLQYRFQEVIYGSNLKAIIEEKFGAGIMSAIDFPIDVEKAPDPKGNRVKVTMCGEFLPDKTWWSARWCIHESVDGFLEI